MVGDVVWGVYLRGRWRCRMLLQVGVTGEVSGGWNFKYRVFGRGIIFDPGVPGVGRKMVGKGGFRGR